jgi:Kef-type K+ transport system membrane component KefB
VPNLFQKAKNKAYIFCLLTALIPLLFGAVLGFVFGYGIIPAIVVGTLLGLYMLFWGCQLLRGWGLRAWSQ